MSITRFKCYNPGEKPYSRRRTEEEWEPYHLLLSEMHTQRFTRKDMLAKLREVGFDVSPGQLLSQMKKWDMMVYADRVSHSGISQSLDEIMLQSSPEPVIADNDIVNGPADAASKVELDNVPPLPPFSYGHSDESRWRFSAAERSDDTADGASFSSLEDLDELPLEGYYRSSKLDVTAVHPDSIEEVLVKIPVHALGSDAADPSSILRQISTITEPWCGNFPTTCCCQAFFRGQGIFASSPELYKIILDQSSPQSLIYIVALLNLVETKPAGEGRLELPTQFWDAVDFYLRACTRVDHKNKLAPHILHRLLRIWEVSDGDCLPFPVSEFPRSSAARTHESLINKILKTRPSTSEPRQPSSHTIDWQIESERDVGCVVGFTVRRPSTFPLLNCAGEVFGSTDSWNDTNNNDGTQRDLTELIPAANQIAAYMQSQWYNGIAMHTAYDLGDCDLPLIFTALGLMIALETTSFAHDFSDSKTWSPGLQAFIDTTVNTLSLNADYADKFRKAYWLVRCNKIGHHGKIIHMGEPCTAIQGWAILDRSIHDYDEERTWFERRLFSGRQNTWPQQANDLMTLSSPNGDNMSIRSGESFNSFSRFQALALHLKVGTPASRSTKTRSSARSRSSSESHMSWRLERMLQIRDDDDDETEQEGGLSRRSFEPGTLTSAQRAQLDQMAFEKMRYEEMIYDCADVGHSLARHG